MLLPFSGKGFLVPVVGFGALIATEYGVERWFNDPTYYQQHGWPKLLGLWLGAALLAGVSQRVHEQQARTLIEPETGRTVVVEGKEHQFLYLPLKYWPVALFVLGFVFLFVKTGGT